MRTTKTVTLSRPTSAADGKLISELVFEEPSARLFFELGPLSVSYVKNGIEAASDLDGVLMAYAERCIRNLDAPLLTALVAELPLIDGIAIRRAFGAFFRDAFDKLIGVAMAETATDASATTAAA